MRRVRIGDKVLRLRDEPEPSAHLRRAGEPAPLLCLHGAGMSSVVWMQLVKRLPPARRVIAPDLPGHGQSDRFAGEISLDAYREAVGALYGALGLERAILVGHSMGAAIALQVALRWPERVAALVLVNGGAELEVAAETLELLERSLPSEPNGDHEKIDRLPAELSDLFFSPATAADLRARWQAVLFCAEREVVLGDFRACVGVDFVGDLATLRMPTLMVAGSEDLLMPPSLLAKTAAALPHSTLHTLEPSGHLSHLEQPERFLKLLEDFLRNPPGGETSAKNAR